MQVGDRVLFYHSSHLELGIAGLAELCRRKALAGTRLLARGNHLFLTPVNPDEWKFITAKLLK